MTVPQSVLVVALVAMWLVVLVPSSSRRRRQVKQVVDGAGFRVVRRPGDRTGRKIRRIARPRTAGGNEGQMSGQQTDLEPTADGVDERMDGGRAAVVEPPGDEEQTIQLSLIPDEDPSAPAREPAAEDENAPAAEHVEGGSSDQAEPVAVQAAPPPAAAGPWGQPGRSARTANAEHVAERPIPRRPGRGTFDPEVAERDRAFKYRRRRRTLLALLLVTAAFVVAAVTVMPSLWIGAGLAAVLTALFLVYLRRQVRIEADIRARRLARLERARQIRPEWSPSAPGDAAQASAPARPHRVRRSVVEMDDEDPSFDHLEQYEEIEYRRASGQ